MKKFWLLALGSIAALLGTSCGSIGRFNYPANEDDLEVVSRAPIIPCRVGVLPFVDRREQENHAGGLGLYLLPFMPYGYVEYYRPELGSHFVSISRFDCDPSMQFAEASAYSLRRSNLFGDAFVVQKGQVATAELVFTGEVRNTTYRGRIFTYGITPFLCWAMWLVGFPEGNSANQLEVKFTISRPGNPKAYWEYSYKNDDWLVHWIYYNSGSDVDMYAAMYQDAMNLAIGDLKGRLHRNPNLFQN